jgi:hypothetical protein
VNPAQAHPPRPAHELSSIGADRRVMFATLAPDRTPEAVDALRRSPDQAQRRRRPDQKTLHDVRFSGTLTRPHEDGCFLR